MLSNIMLGNIRIRQADTKTAPLTATLPYHLLQPNNIPITPNPSIIHRKTLVEWKESSTIGVK